jgi:hypothetical protein
MEKSQPSMPSNGVAPDFDPEQMGARFWYEQYLKQREENQQLHQQLSQLQAEVEQLGTCYKIKYHLLVRIRREKLLPPAVISRIGI